MNQPAFSTKETASRDLLRCALNLLFRLGKHTVAAMQNVNELSLKYNGRLVKITSLFSNTALYLFLFIPFFIIYFLKYIQNVLSSFAWKECAIRVW